MQNFKNLYQLSKTLRFELIPQGKTLGNIQCSGILSNDEQRAESYKKMKKTLDRFHKYFIELAMSQVKLTQLETFAELYNANIDRKKEESYKTEFDKVKTDLRKEIARGFSSDVAKPIFDKIDKKELITELLEDWIRKQQDTDIYFDQNFKNFTTYFGGFHTNRKNMYSDKEQSTAIAYRLVHENLPKFIDNIKIFETLKTKPELFDKCAVLYKEIEEYLNIASIDEAFVLNYYNEVLTQKQIDVYNLIIGGRSPKEGEKKIQGLNEYINEFNQKQEDKKNRVPKLKMLYKQILSDRESISFLPEMFEESQEVLDAIEEYYQVNIVSYQPKDKENTDNVLTEIKKLLASIKDYDLNKIYLRNDTKLTGISQKLFGNYGVFSDALNYYYETVENPKFKNEYQKANEKKRENLDNVKNKFTKQPYIAIAFLQNAVNVYVATLDATHEIKNKYSETCIADYFHTHFKAEKTEESNKEFGLIANIEAKYSCVKGILNIKYPTDKKLLQEQNDIDNIKVFLDSLMEFLHFVKPLVLRNEKRKEDDKTNKKFDVSVLEKDNNFYGQFDEWYKQLNLLIPFYNKVRNYVTQKPYKTDKIRLFFENKGQFLGGWVDSKTENSDNGTQAGGYLFRKKNSINEYDYYLGISSDAKLFRNDNKIEQNDKSLFERLDYYQLKTQSIYGSSYQDGEYAQDKNVLIFCIDNYVSSQNDNSLNQAINNERAKKQSSIETPSGYLKFLEKYPEIYDGLLKDNGFMTQNKLIIDRLQNTLKTLKRVPSAENLSTKKYLLFTEIINDIDTLSNEKVFSYFSVSQSELDAVTSRKEKTLLFFKIMNKDLSYAETYSNGKRKSRGTENLHTLYFKALMQGNQSTLDIGTGMVFHREQSIKNENRTIHSANQPIDNKNINNQKKQSIFTYDIIKNKRYTKEHHFQFHLSIVQNYTKPKTPQNFNDQVNQYIKDNGVKHIIGIDRGERHLLYLSLIDLNGKIVQQFSLNEIVNEYNGNTYKTNYNELLSKKGDDKKEAQKNWNEIETIKELKEGYLSQVIHKIATMMVEYNAIVVLEDLNFGFMRGRQKVEKQVYQKFEKILIDKLNYLVDKKKQPTEDGGLLNAYQLTNKFESFKKEGKQNGFLFYIPAWNTSKMDPITGFVNLFDTRYTNVGDAKKFFAKFANIRYNKDKNYFEFVVDDYSKFSAKAEGTQLDWTICTYSDRIITFRNVEKNSQWDNKEVNLTKEFEDFFTAQNIGFQNGEELKTAIATKTDKDFFEKLLGLFKLTLQMRNSITNNTTDYLISPVANATGNFYDSRQADDTKPKDADANGAYNIARKGLWAVEQIKKAEDLKKINLAISNKEWLNYVQQ